MELTSVRSKVSMLKISVLVFSILTGLLIPGCVTLNMPTSRAKIQVSNGDLKAVLFQVNAKCVDWDTYWADGEPLISDQLAGDKIQETLSFLAGNFETGGYLSLHPVFFLSEETMADGWMLLLLKGQSQYLSVVQQESGPLTYVEMLEYQNYVSRTEANKRAYYKFKPEWKLPINEGENLIYAGRLNLAVYIWDWGIFGKSYFYHDMPPFGEDVMEEIPPDTPPEMLSKIRAFNHEFGVDLTLGDEQYALSLLRQHFPGSGEPVVRLLQKHESGPLIFEQ